MAIFNNRYEVSDPAYYDPLIADQKKLVREHPEDIRKLLELGRLHEAKIDMINYFARRNIGIRYFIPIFLALFLFVIIFLSYSISIFPSLSSLRIAVISIAIIFILILFRYFWSLRYPSSGEKYFKKVIALDPKCGEAYMYLGLIALRRYQKRKGCRLLEQAIRFNVGNKKIGRELKTVYEKEFMTFFNRKTEKEIRLEQIIDHQLTQIKELHSKVSSLERLTESLTGRVDQAKWEINHKTKLLAKEMKDQVESIQKDYEIQIATMKRSNEPQEDAKDLAGRDFVRLTTEIMEAKVELEGQSLAEVAKTVEETMSSQIWQLLLPQTRTYLTTAEHIFAVLTKEEGKPDYSLIGMELCKALETEINRTLVGPFLKYLHENEKEFLRVNQVGVSKGKPLYFTYLAKVVDRENFPEVNSLTLGQYHFILKKTLKDEYALKDYGGFLDHIFASQGVIIGKAFLKKIETVIKRYRNVITHKSPMNKKQCSHLRELIFLGDKALLITCCRIMERGGVGGQEDRVFQD